MKPNYRIWKWPCGVIAVVAACQFYFVQELIAAFAFFAIGFAALALVVVSLYMLQKSWEMTVAHFFDGKRSALQRFKTEGSAGEFRESRTNSTQSRRQTVWRLCNKRKFHRCGLCAAGSA